jgi:hypothetical protein
MSKTGWSNLRPVFLFGNAVSARWRADVVLFARTLRMVILFELEHASAVQRIAMRRWFC